MSVKSTAHLLPDPITAFPLSIGLQTQSGFTDFCVNLIDNPDLTKKKKKKTRIEVDV